ncbi:MAG: hypothetical protein NTU61_05130 [Candidatus Altiarchaeota archaeon]|nr:hypothetical protein [Candidatus Altiarchaeota archaeon]
MPKYTKSGGTYFDARGQGELFPDLIDSELKVSDQLKKKLGEALTPEKAKQVFDYLERQEKAAPRRSSYDILLETVTVPEGQPEYLHPANFPEAYSERALRLIADRIAREPGHGDAHSLYERMKHGLGEYMFPMSHALEAVIAKPGLVENVDFRDDKRRSEDSTTRMLFTKALSIRSQAKPALEDHELHLTLNKIPYPRLEPGDIAKIQKILAEAKPK